MVSDTRSAVTRWSEGHENTDCSGGSGRDGVVWLKFVENTELSSSALSSGVDRRLSL